MPAAVPRCPALHRRICGCLSGARPSSRAVLTAIAQRPVGIGQIEQRDLAAAQRQAEAIVAAAFTQRQAQLLELLENASGVTMTSVRTAGTLSEDASAVRADTSP